MHSDPPSPASADGSTSFEHHNELRALGNMHEKNLITNVITLQREYETQTHEETIIWSKMLGATSLDISAGVSSPQLCQVCIIPRLHKEQGGSERLRLIVFFTAINDRTRCLELIYRHRKSLVTLKY